MAGDKAVIEQVCREHCMEVGLCVTVQAAEFIYTGGQESGVEVGLVNYPRFPSTPVEIKAKALTLAEKMIERACQWSALVVTPTESVWLDRRPA